MTRGIKKANESERERERVVIVKKYYDPKNIVDNIEIAINCSNNRAFVRSPGLRVQTYLLFISNNNNNNKN